MNGFVSILQIAAASDIIICETRPAFEHGRAGAFSYSIVLNPFLRSQSFDGRLVKLVRADYRTAT